ncbi:hypothetical protein BH10ACT3_BH10ACT3_03410 [soil metagenome]
MSSDDLENNESNDMEFEHELRARLRGDQLPLGDAADLEALRPRFRRARQRRQVAIAAVSSAAVIAVIAVGSVVLGSGDTQAVRVAGNPDRSTTTSPTTSTSTTLPSTSTTAVPDTTVPAAPDPAPTTVPGAGNPGSSPDAPEITTTVAPPPPVTAPTTSAPAAGGTTTLSSDGGTATIQWTASSAVVLSTAPAAGWERESVEQKDPTRVVVKFRRPGGGSGSNSATIDARVENGELVNHG